MAITINGTSNTITGLAVGGVPDGTIDTDALAAGAVTAAKRGAGAILQILQTTTTTQVSNETTSYVDTNLTGNITPASTSNKILIIISQAFEMKKSGSDCGGNIKLMRDSTDLNEIVPSQDYGMYLNVGSGNSSRYDVYNLSYLDSPSTTSQVTYKTQCKGYYSADNHAFKAQVASAKSFLTLIEVAG
mgnify:CR=1 FL=1